MKLRYRMDQLLMCLARCKLDETRTIWGCSPLAARS